VAKVSARGEPLGLGAGPGDGEGDGDGDGDGEGAGLPLLPLLPPPQAASRAHRTATRSVAAEVGRVQAFMAARM
jgi:hypothetical protein